MCSSVCVFMSLFFTVAHTRTCCGAYLSLVNTEVVDAGLIECVFVCTRYRCFSLLVGSAVVLLCQINFYACQLFNYLLCTALAAGALGTVLLPIENKHYFYFIPF